MTLLFVIPAKAGIFHSSSAVLESRLNNKHTIKRITFQLTIEHSHLSVRHREKDPGLRRDDKGKSHCVFQYTLRTE